MAVTENNRGFRRMKVFTEAETLAVYTIKICSNPNVFKPEYSKVTDELVKLAIDIFADAYEANGIKVIDEDSAQDRLKLQQQSIRHCKRLLALMPIAQKLFHLDTKRIKFWGGKVVEVKTMLQNWTDSDARRYERFYI